MGGSGEGGGRSALADFRGELGFEGVVDFLLEGVGLGVGEGAFGGAVGEGVGKALAAGEVLAFVDVEEFDFFEFGGGSLLGDLEDLLVADGWDGRGAGRVWGGC